MGYALLSAVWMEGPGADQDIIHRQVGPHLAAYLPTYLPDVLERAGRAHLLDQLRVGPDARRLQAPRSTTQHKHDE